jgi:hypothetical protein
MALEAQAPPARVDAPAAALAFFVGDWKQVGTVRTNGGSNYVPLSGSETCDWIDDRNAVTCRETVSNGTERSDTLYVLSWDEARGLYRMQGTDYATGIVMTGTGRRVERNWLWDTVARSGGGRSDLRYVFQAGEGGTRRLTVSLMGAAGHWTTVQNVTYTRSAEAAPAPLSEPVARPEPAPTRSLPAGTPRRSGRLPLAPRPDSEGTAPVEPARLSPEPETQPGAKLRIEVPEIGPVKKPEIPEKKTYPVPRLLPEGKRPGLR